MKKYDTFKVLKKISEMLMLSIFLPNGAFAIFLTCKRYIYSMEILLMWQVTTLRMRLFLGGIDAVCNFRIIKHIAYLIIIRK